MSNKLVYGIFDDEHKLMHAISALKQKGLNIVDVISPYPIHDLDDAIGLKRTRISICCFLYGATGTSLALLMMWYMNIFDWPMDIGGKPSFALYKNLPAFIPVLFESTVLCAAHGMVITFFLRSKILPGVEPKIIDPRQSDDRMVMAIKVKNNQVVADLKRMILSEGAVEFKE
jgi:hypothetical protein